MKSPALNPVAIPKKFRQGFTLVEMMTVMGIFIIVVGAMVSLQIFSLRVYTLAATKITATASGRELLNRMRERIRSAQVVYVGTYTNNAFSQTPLGTPQIGNAIETIPAMNATNATIFYMDPASNVVNMVSGGVVSVEARYMTNYLCFQAEDYQQNIQTNYVDNPVICITLNFYQWEFPIGRVGGSGANAYDFYRLRTRIARRYKS